MLRKTVRDWSSNDWKELWRTGTPSPTLSASVVVTAYQNQGQLDTVLTGLAMQDYPSHLTEVVVADDGSEPPLTVGHHSNLDIVSLWQPDEGYRLGAARNLGARAARGDVVLFLDSDMIPEPHWISAHMRLHHRCPWLLVCGFRRHVATTAVTPEELTSSGGPSELFYGAEIREPEWLISFWDSHDAARANSQEVWRASSGGNLSVTASAFRAVGGFDEEHFQNWGGEDNEFGYRIYQEGAFVIPEPEALAWHLGWGTSDSPEAEALRLRTRWILASKIPDRDINNGVGIHPIVPEVTLELHVADSDREDILRGVSNIHASGVSTGTVLVVDDGDEGGILRTIFAGDSRVRVGQDNVPEAWRYSRIQVESSSARWHRGDLQKVSQAVGESKSGKAMLLHTDGVISEAILTRLQNQIRVGLISEDSLDKDYGAIWLTSTPDHA